MLRPCDGGLAAEQRPYNGTLSLVCLNRQTRRYTRRRASVRGRDRAGHAGPSFSCAIQVHSSSHCCSAGHDSRGSFLRLRRIRRENTQGSRLALHSCLAPRLIRARPESDATSACANGVMVVALAPLETQPAEIPRCSAANSSARDSPHADAPRRLQAGRCRGPETTSQESLSYSSCILLTNGGAEAAWGGRISWLRSRAVGNESR